MDLKRRGFLTGMGGLITSAFVGRAKAHIRARRGPLLVAPAKAEETLFAYPPARDLHCGRYTTSLREGMISARVEVLMGRPDSFQRSGDVVGYEYTNRLMSGWGWDRADHYAIFQEDRLVRWGRAGSAQARDQYRHPSSSSRCKRLT
ncbi:hypothetical protein [Benzoatithermus flavus]|uniref:Uncharacterized protein n=1 Tax=Benzoatithermus flavus TaxID=3108223 RepID=A0ABU8XSI4_9PROT